MKSLEGNLVDVIRDGIYPARITFNQRILKIEKRAKSYGQYILPGLIDAHIHLESTMLCPSRFVEVVLPHGTIATVSDPHEIANVAGIKGVLYMITDVPALSKLKFTAPSCVPVTPYETSGAVLGVAEVRGLLKHRAIVGLGEVMNYPAVLRKEREIMGKMKAAKREGKAVDGHAPSLSGWELRRYVGTGPNTDHESTSYSEGREKLEAGMKLMLRQGSAEKNFRELIRLAEEFPRDCFLVSDDRHVGDLIEGHVDSLLRDAVGMGLDPLTAVRCCTSNPAKHYGLNTGIIEEGAPADFVVVKDLENFEVLEVWINGEKVAKNGKCLVKVKPKRFRLHIKRYKLEEEDFLIRAWGRERRVRVIEIIPGRIFTKAGVEELKCERGIVLPDERKKICYAAVVNRYEKSPISKAFVGGLYVEGAIASSVSHDAHNLVIAGNNARDMKAAAEAIMRVGGIAFSERGKVTNVPLPIAGLMSDERAPSLAKKFRKLHERVWKSGCDLEAPFTQLSFLTLLVVPELKLCDRGLFDSRKFKFVELFV